MEVTTIESKAYRDMTSKIDNIEKSALNFRPNNPVKSEKDRPRCGCNPLPDTSDKAELQKILCRSPQEYGYDTATRTGALVRDYIKKRYGVEYKKAQIYNILHSVGFSFQKEKGYFPEAKDHEERVEAIKKLQTADRNSVTIFEDEALLSNTATVSYNWSKRGEQPRICQPQRRKERRTLFGCVCPDTGKLIPDVAEKGNTITFFRFLFSAVQHYKDKKVYMLLDNMWFHHTKRLDRILKRYAHRIGLIFLPPYSPGLNPVERILWLMRKEITRNRWVKSMQQRVHDFEQWYRNKNCSSIKRVCKLNVNI